MTKKEFKEKCRFDDYITSGGRRSTIAIFYDWQSGDIDGKYFGGYKYRVSARISDCKKAELFNVFYDWVIKEHEPPYYVDYKYAETDQQRFKVPLSL